MTVEVRCERGHLIDGFVTFRTEAQRDAAALQATEIRALVEAKLKAAVKSFGGEWPVPLSPAWRALEIKAKPYGAWRARIEAAAVERLRLAEEQQRGEDDPR